MAENARAGRRSRVIAVVLLVVATVLVLPSGSSPARAYASANVGLTGHGWGHGRGMGQYGGLGYALAGQPYQQILDHYYGGTSMASASNIPISVHLTEIGGDVIAVQERGHMTTSAKAGSYTALRASRIGTTTSYNLYASTNCGGNGNWGAPIATVAGPVTFSPSVENDDRTEMLQLCESYGTRWYRGSIAALVGDGASRAVNYVALESYLRGVVPRESPASWGALGGGRGQQALNAQAVAARSYGMAENRSSWAKTCDTTSCQVYGGRAVQTASGFTDLEGTPTYASTDGAVSGTAGQVRVFNGTSTIARTEFSSSTGGYTAGGTFPAVVDDGDATTQNPNHTWTASIPVTSIQNAYPSIGTLQAVDITQRNGLGDWGGRVLQVAVRGSSGSVTVSGYSFQSTFGLKSNWFTVGGQPSGGVSGYWQVAADGGIFSFGNAVFHGSTGGIRLNAPILGMAATPSGGGYWLVAGDGGIFTFGDAVFRGSTGSIRLNQPIVGMASTKTGNGYWLVASDGGIFAFGDAVFRGSTGSIRLNKPIVGMAATRSGNGYWLVATDGGIFAFGDAAFHGSTGSIRLNQPIVGMANTPGGGYWLVAADGGIFSFGDAPYKGSLPGAGLPGPAVGMRATSTGGGYVIATAPGRMYPFGDAPYFGDVASAIPGWSGSVRDLAVVRG